MNNWTYPHMRYFPCPKGKEEKIKEAMSNGKYFAQRKWDGASYIFSLDEYGDIGLHSRSVSKKTGTFSEKSQNVPHITEYLAEHLPCKTMLIGEIAYPDGTSKDTTTIMGCLPAKAQARNKEKPISYYVFDLLWFDGEDYTSKSAIERIQKLEEVFKECNLETENIHFVEPVFDDINIFLADILASGGEGIVLKMKDKPYDTEGKRPAWHTIKVKQIDTADVVVLDVEMPNKEYQGKDPDNYPYRDEDDNPVNRLWYLGYANSLVIGAYNENGNLIKIGTVASGLTDEDREDAANNPDNWIGKVVEIEAMSLNKKDKTFRHPRLIRIREDKDAEDCLLSEIFA